MSKNKLIILGILVILLIAATATFLLLPQRKSAAPQSSQTTTSESNVEKKTPPPGIGPMVDLEPFIVNILDHENTRYLKAAITLEVDSAETSSEAEKRMPQLQDAILLLVGNKTFDELRDLQGKLQLRAELMEQLNQIIEKGKVRKIYFTDFVVQ